MLFISGYPKSVKPHFFKMVTSNVMRIPIDPNIVIDGKVMPQFSNGIPGVNNGFFVW